MSKKTNDQDTQKIIELYKSGKSAKDISNLINISSTAVLSVLKRNKIKTRTYSETSRKYSVDENYFSKIDNQNKAYFLGFLMADGYNNQERKSVELSSAPKDKEILEKLNSEISSNKPVRKVVSNGVESYRIDWFGEKLSNDLANLGCVQNKTFKVVVPDLPEELIRHFIRGYFDGDGCISFSYVKKDNLLGSLLNAVVTMVGTESLCTYLKKYIFEKFKFNTTMLCRHPDHNNCIRTLQLAGNQQVIAFMSWLYKDAEIYLARKMNKFVELKDILKDRKECLLVEKSKLLNLSEIVETGEKRWIARHLISRKLVEHSGKSRFTKEQAENLIEKIDNFDNSVFDCVDEIFNKYRKNGFPYTHLTEEEMTRIYLSLKNNSFDGYFWDGYGTQVATHFHKHLYSCKKPKKISPIEFFKNDAYLKSAIKKAFCLYTNVTDGNIREVCRNDNRSSRVNNFPPRVAISILKNNYCEKVRVLDPCAGFSGRIIGCSASGLVSEYTGIDISEKTFSGLWSTKEFLNSLSDMKTNLIFGDCLEKMSGKHDCILTSPPFLNVEIYDGVEYETDYEKWTEDFIKPFVSKCFECLVSGGKMFIYLEKIGRINFPLDFTKIANGVGFSNCDSIKFKVPYGENNRKNSPTRSVDILVFKK